MLHSRILETADPIKLADTICKLQEELKQIRLVREENNKVLEKVKALGDNFINYKGSFTLPFDFVNNNPATVMSILGRCLIVRCEMLWISHSLEYLAMSLDFDEAPEGFLVPKYDLIFSEDGSFLRFSRKGNKEHE